ncbi:uncharacterized protein METZ01_LOCUS406553, partial [marine metagenome]
MGVGESHRSVIRYLHNLWFLKHFYISRAKAEEPALQEQPMAMPLRTHIFLFYGLFALLPLATALNLHAQEKPGSKPSTTPGSEKESQPIFFLRDGSRIAGQPGFNSLQVKTRYGILTVPSGDLIRLR